jgi:PDZ domain-containing protein
MAGFGLAAVFSILGETIWLGDPLRWGGYYWIDQIQWLVRLLAIVPLLWTAGAIAAIRSRRGIRSRTFHRWLIAAGGVLTAAVIVWNPEDFDGIFVPAAVTGILALVDIALLEMQRRGRWTWGCFVHFIVVPLVGAGLFWPTPYGITTPGFTLNMERYISVEDGTQKGSIEGVLVIERPAFPIDWLFAAVFPHLQIEKRDTSISIGEMRQAAQIQRADANEIGSAVAFQKLGFGQGVVPTGVEILKVMEGSPAAGRLKPGDVLVGLNNRPVSSTAELTGLMSKIEPGAEVAVTVERGGRKLEMTAKTTASGDEPSRAVFGVQVQDRLKVDLPKQVAFRQYLVYQGGPSHGAVLALTLLDELTPGGVTYGNRVAGTGTIDANGNVGVIGGIEQKAYAVSRAGADVFFVPAEQAADARKGAPNLNIVPVRTLDDMLNWLRAHPKQR